jgi:tetratricopeptide (TPR) repeat protein
MFYGQGGMLLNLGNVSGAEAAFTRAIELDPEYFPAFALRGWTRLMQQHTDRAIDDFTRAVDLTTGNYPHALHGRARAWRAKGDLDKA